MGPLVCSDVFGGWRCRLAWYKTVHTPLSGRDVVGSGMMRLNEYLILLYINEVVCVSMEQLGWSFEHRAIELEWRCTWTLKPRDNGRGFSTPIHGCQWMSCSGTGKRKRAQAIDSIVSVAKEEWSLS